MSDKRTFAVEIGSPIDQALNSIISNVAAIKNVSPNQVSDVQAIGNGISLGNFLIAELAKKHKIFIEDEAGQKVQVSFDLS